MRCIKIMRNDAKIYIGKTIHNSIIKRNKDAKIIDGEKKTIRVW